MAQLTTKILETVELNGESIRRLVSKTYTIASIYRRTVKVPSGVDTTLVAFKSTVGIGAVVVEDIQLVKYIRVTNASASSPVNL